MQTCTSCGRDVTGKKFCPDCGTAVRAMEVATAVCPRCSGTIKPNAAFCMHCGTSLGAQALAATTAASQPVVQQCPACHTEIPANSAFCTNCGQSFQASQMPSAPVAPASLFCTGCGTQNMAGSHFCNRCGQDLTNAVPAQLPTSQPYMQQPPSQYNPQPYPAQPPQYGQQQYMVQQPVYPSQQQYPAQQPYPGQQQYAPQGGYGQPAPMLGQQPMVLRCPVCQALAQQGTPNCLSCHTSLAGVVPMPAAALQGQQQQAGGLGNMLQGNAGKYAVGALGGAAAVLGGEMLLHGVERDFEGGGGWGGDGYEHHRHHHEEGLLGGLGNLGNDIGLF